MLEWMRTHQRSAVICGLTVIIPLLVNIVIFASLIGVGLSYLFEFMDRWLSWIPEWLSFVEWILWPLIGLAISLMMGEIAATVLSRMAVPVVYYLIARRGRADELHQQGLA